TLPESWHGKARLFWRSGLPDHARLCQEKVRALTFGEIPRELWLSGRLEILSPTSETPVFLDEQAAGKARVSLAEVKPGEHRLRWESGPSRRFFLEEGECLRMHWAGRNDEISIQSFVPEVTEWKVNLNPDSTSVSPADSLLKPYMVRRPTEWPVDSDCASILADVPGPISPFGTEGRLTIETVFRLLLEEILADGVLDHAEHDLIRAVRYRLLIDSHSFRAIMDEARKKVLASRRVEKSGHLDHKSLYARVYRKACEDGVVDPSEKILLGVIAECLFLTKEDVERIEREAEKADRI
ncbi:MAG TPA: hypothetical protein PKO06_14170, partial [Candidatus Ozemobacteraceae bacterium]|nr:hypothetical protein [Candidatus Ozemobacteraceae bacterium]